MKKTFKKLQLSKETLWTLAASRLAEVGGASPAPYDPISNQPEQCTGASCIPRNCTG
ncbi:MAG: hypothetical protein ACJ75H_05755 [Thermoanaerobaculia bacterium]